MITRVRSFELRSRAAEVLARSNCWDLPVASRTFDDFVR